MGRVKCPLYSILTASYCFKMVNCFIEKSSWSCPKLVFIIVILHKTLKNVNGRQLVSKRTIFLENRKYFLTQISQTLSIINIVNSIIESKILTQSLPDSFDRFNKIDVLSYAYNEGVS